MDIMGVQIQHHWDVEDAHALLERRKEIPWSI
jgi:hypothetical protein